MTIALQVPGIDLQLYLDVYGFWREEAIAVKNATGANQTFTIQPVTTSLVEQGVLKGGNALGLPNENFQCELASGVIPLFFGNIAYCTRLDNSHWLDQCHRRCGGTSSLYRHKRKMAEAWKRARTVCSFRIHERCLKRSEPTCKLWIRELCKITDRVSEVWPPPSLPEAAKWRISNLKAIINGGGMERNMTSFVLTEFEGLHAVSETLLRIKLLILLILMHLLHIIFLKIIKIGLPPNFHWL